MRKKISTNILIISLFLTHSFIFCNKNSNTPEESNGSEILLNYSKIDFGELYNGLSSTEKMEITNVGDMILKIDSLIIDSTKNFIIADNSPCRIDVDHSKVFDVIFFPTKAKIDSSTLKIFNNSINNSICEITLTGKGKHYYVAGTWTFTSDLFPDEKITFFTDSTFKSKSFRPNPRFPYVDSYKVTDPNNIILDHYHRLLKYTGIIESNDSMSGTMTNLPGYPNPDSTIINGTWSARR